MNLKDATDGENLVGATCAFFADGTKLQGTGTSDASGKCSISGINNNTKYGRLRVTHSGYIDYNSDGIQGRSPPSQIELSPRLDTNIRADKGEGGSQRLVLTWGRNVPDVDSHMFTPKKGCKVWWEDMQCKDDALGFNVELDVDDTDFN